MDDPFFIPRVGKNYQQGFHGVRTLVLGTAHICNIPCRFKELCCNPDGVREMDYKCPCYTNFPCSDTAAPEEEMCLHNGNFIEMTAYHEDETGYPTYSHFTKYMLRRKDGLTPDEKVAFWDQVLFTNLLQCYVPSKILPAYADNQELYRRAMPVLQTLLEEYQPQLVYVWGREAMIALQNNLDALPGLQQESLVPEHPTMELSLFSYKYKTKAVTTEYIRYYIADRLPQRQICFSAEGIRYGAAPLETAIANGLKRGLLLFDNGELVISPQRPEQEGSTFLYIMRCYYDLTQWDDIALLFKKYDKSGRPVKDLRKMRRYNPAAKDTKGKETEMQRKIFGVKAK